MNDQEKYTIGYIDEEPAFVAKFRNELQDAFDIVSFDLNPDKTLAEMLTEIEDAELDCLVVDFELKEAAVVQFNGDEIIESYKSKYPHFPVFIITSKDEDEVLDQVIDGDIVRLKDELTSKPKILIQRISNKIESYKSSISNAEQVITEIISKRNSGQDLTVDEEELLSEKYIFLDQIDPDGKVLPENLLQRESVSKFTEFASEAKEILEALNKLNNG